jgi:hypothetical protein
MPAIIREVDAELAAAVRVLRARPDAQLSVASSGYSAEQPPRYTETSQSACERSLRAFTSAPPTRTTARARRTSARRIRGRHATVGIEVPTPDVQLDRDALLWRPCAGKGGDRNNRPRT